MNAQLPLLWRIGIISALFLSVAACKKKDTGDPTVDPPGNAAGVYIGYTAGSQWKPRSAKIWKDGGLQSLADSTTNIYITGLAVTDGGDVYAAGCECKSYTQPFNIEMNDSCDIVLWKNGIKQQLTDTSFPSTRNVEVFVTGNGDVYVASNIIVAGYTFSPLVLWKNGQRQAIIGSGGDTTYKANDLFISGSDVYIAGNKRDPASNGVPVLWKNGIQQPISNQTPGGYISSVWVDGSDVYHSVYGQVDGFYKNDVLITLPVGLNTADKIIVSGGSVYMLAKTTSYKTVVIKDGEVLFELAPLVDDNDVLYCRSMAVKGNDVYVAGDLYTPSTNVSKGLLWKNGQIDAALNDGAALTDIQTLVVK